MGMVDHARRAILKFFFKRLLHTFPSPFAIWQKKTLLPFVEGGSYLAMFLRSDGNLAEVMPSAKVSFLRRKAPTVTVSTSKDTKIAPQLTTCCDSQR